MSKSLGEITLFRNNFFFRKTAFMLLFGLGLTQIGQAQFGSSSNSSTSSSKIPIADSIWSSLPTFPTGSFRDGIEKSTDLFYRLEQYDRNYRSIGLRFWHDFPNDARRYKWLHLTVKRPPFYWKDPYDGAVLKANQMYGSKKEVVEIPFDSNLVRAWNAIYPKLRTEYLASSTISDSMKAVFRRDELNTFLWNPILEEKIDIKQLHSLFRISAEESYTPNAVGRLRNNGPLRAIESIYIYKNHFKLSNKDLLDFTQVYLSSKNTVVRNWAKAKLAGFKLQTEPFELHHVDMDGERIIDLSQLRGKVILLDFWATTCSACIARMRDIKPIYEKYKEQGFEVISISVDSEDRLPAVRKIKERIGADWPTVVIGGKTIKDYSLSLASRIFDSYAFKGVPQLLLLDKKGLMRELNGVLHKGDFEPLLKELLLEKL